MDYSSDWKQDLLLENLFGSRTRFVLLYIFFTHPDKFFYVRELTRMADIQIHAVRRELLNLVQVGILEESESLKGDEGGGAVGIQEKRYFQVAKAFRLYPELQGLFLKSQFFFREQYFTKILALGGIDYFAATGFFTDAESPVDILLVMDQSRTDIRSLLAEYEAKLGRSIRFSIFSPDEFRYRQGIGDKFLDSILNARKIVVWDRIRDVVADTQA
ncbi:MAG: hypothetical protein G01um101418_71 [Parcubacteria group bacterium Gr01-1014_18]|nr:MAG: hypothetical protein Greene041636_71 [Parcubacteria group bacterium Greene0416_36]TSC81577.1 MAG: hypothetical protein G01um101418_71 [Parcubacteria group bacterium Gr01-1014_18]TSC99612.1 MAG: hypothetical protein Greene101420_16 [Parcubacteria group bacterium Greene1014_20]TSD07063.1 MAG: hypothetical protein Greene07142_375 [Parcubacteria group bacterium Greene0714_2]